MYGLVIQGPLISKGRTGKTANIPFDMVTEEDIVTFDCIDNIDRINKQFGKCFSHIICVTWENQPKVVINRLSKVLSNKQILLIKDDSKIITIKGNVIPGNNKNRQFLSTMHGVRFLQNNGCQFVIKIRTDQMFDLNRMILDMKEMTNLDTQILVPWLNPISHQTIVEIPDLYFGGKVQTMLAFCKCMINDPEIFEHVHTDIFFKWGLSPNALFLRKYLKVVGSIGNSILIEKFVKKQLTNRFVSASPSILKDMVWRGEVYETNTNNLIFGAQDWEKLRIPKISNSKLLELIKKKLIKKFLKFIKGK